MSKFAVKCQAQDQFWSEPKTNEGGKKYYILAICVYTCGSKHV